MKSKIYKMSGIALALVLVLSMFAAFIPANTQTAEAQAYTENQWNAMMIPGAPGLTLMAGANVVDYAVAADGKTIYLCDNVSWGVAKSTDGGRTFNWLFGNVAIGAPAAPAGWTGVDRPGAIAVAKDDPNTAALIEVDTTTLGLDAVWITTDGGSTWASMADPSVGGSATEVLTDIAVSPARTGTILGRDFAVCSVDTAAATFGDIYVVGQTATWVAVATAAGQNYDWTSIALAPNWVGDRVVIGVGSEAGGGGNAPIDPAVTVGDTFLVSINVATVVPSLAGPGAVRMDAATTDSPPEVGPGTTDIITSSISLPSDFDSTSVANFRAYVGWASTQVGGVTYCADDAYRVDFNSVRKLEVRPTVALNSVSFFGTVASGTLMVGQRATTGVWFSSDPQVSLPTWEFSFKGPTGTNNTIVTMTSDTNAFACAAGGNGAFSYTVDGGLSFNGCAFIDEVIFAINDVMPAPDGSSVFMATDDAAGAGSNHSIWRCYGMPSSGGWDRVGFRTPASAPGPFSGDSTIIRMSPYYLTDSTVYWFETGVGALTTIRRSTNDGQIWGTRTLPASPIVDATVESQDMLYVINATNVWASDNGGWFFGLPVNAGIGTLGSINMCASYPYEPVAGHVVVGAGAAGTPGGVALSTDSGASFTSVLAFSGGGAMIVLADKSYADNNILYAGSAVVGQGVYKFVVGSYTAWEQIDPIAGCTVSGLATHCGLLYASWSTAGAAPSGADRALYPTAPAPLWLFQQMNVGSAAAVFNTAPSALRACGTDTENVLYAIDTAVPALMAYIDTMAKQTTTVTAPAEIAADPATSRNSAFTISWNRFSNAMAYDIDICLDQGCTQQANRWLAQVPPNPAAPQLFVAAAQGFLSSGTDYYIRVRAVNQVPGDGIDSYWSEVITMKIRPGVPVEVSYLAPQIMGPAAGATGVPVKNTGFTWSPYADTTSYEFKLATDPALSDVLAEGTVQTTAFMYDGTLDYSTTYYWAVRAVEPGVSEWSAVGTFTTEAAPPEPEPEPAPPPEPEPPVVTKTIIWAIIGIGAVLAIAVIVLIIMTRQKGRV